MDPSPPEEDALRSAKHRVALTMGQCLLNLQAFELQLKSVIASAHIVVDLRPVENDRPHIRYPDKAAIDRLTLGQLAEKFFQTFVAIDEGQLDRSFVVRTGATPSFSYRSKILVSAEDRQQLRSAIAALVDERNFIVHNFLLRYPLKDPVSCDAATSHLGEVRDQVKQQHAFLRKLSASLEEEFRAALADPRFLAS